MITFSSPLDFDTCPDFGFSVELLYMLIPVRLLFSPGIEYILTGLVAGVWNVVVLEWWGVVVEEFVAVLSVL